MTLLLHELRQGRRSLTIWTAIIAFMLGVCVLIYPEMKEQMGQMSDMFANMGSFSAAFGMDELNFGEFSGYFGAECGNVLGLGGALFAGLLGITALAKEEKEHTAELLLTHPISRWEVVGYKLAAVLIQIAAMNIIVLIVVAAFSAAIGETLETKIFLLLFLSYFLMQVEIAAICFGISAFLSSSGAGIGLGIAAVFYFMNIIANLSKEAEALKYFTPFGFADGSSIIVDGSIQLKYLAVGMALTIVGACMAFIWYRQKDIR